MHTAAKKLNRLLLLPLLASCFFWGVSCFSQSAFFNNYTELQGLSNNNVRCFTKDHLGYLWIGTNYGLNRFDGKTFKTYFTQNHNSISNNIVSCLATDMQGNIWIGTETGGLNKYNPQANTFTVCKQNINENGSLREDYVKTIFIDSKNDVWIGTVSNGWAKWNKDTQQFTWYQSGLSYTNKWGRNACNIIEKMVEDKQGNFWVASNYGLHVLFKGQPTVHTYIDSAEQTKGYYPMESANLYLDMYYDGDSCLWLGTWAGGLKCFNMRTQKFETYRLQPQLPYAGSRNIVAQVLPKSPTTLWIASLDKGLGTFDMQKKIFNFLIHNPNNLHSVLPNECRALYVDAHQYLFAGFDGGFGVYSPANQIIQTVNWQKNDRPKTGEAIYAIGHNSYNGLTYIGSTNRLYAYNGIKAYLLPLVIAGQVQYEVSAIYYWGNNELLLCCNGRYYLYACGNGQIKNAIFTYKGQPYPLYGYGTATMPGATIQWIKNFNGDWVCLQKGKWTILHIIPKTVATQAQFNGLMVPLAQYSDSLFWFSTRNGQLGLYNIATNNIVGKVMLENDVLKAEIKAVLKDSTGSFWASSYHNGLFQLLPQGNHQFNAIAFDEKNDFPDLFLDKIVQDAKGQIWLNCKKGLIRFAAVSKGRPYFKWFGNGIGSAVGSRAVATMALVNDKLFFGVANEVSYLKLNEQLPVAEANLVINDFWVQGKSVIDSINLNFVSSIILPHHRNFLAFAVAAINFDNGGPGKIAYRYNMPDTSWLEADNNSTISINDLRPGKYLLQLACIGQNGKIAGSVKQITIEIAPAFYQSKAFLLAVLLLLLLLGYFIYWLKVKNIKQQAAQKTALAAQMATLEMRALRAQMNPHFIFNTLNSINNYILNYNAQEASTYLTKFAKLVRLILENSNTATTSLHNELQLVNLFVEMEQRRFKNKFQYDLQVQPEVDPSQQIPGMLIQPFVENAIWHGLMHLPADGLLSIAIGNTGDDCLQIVITDNGIGRQAAKALQSHATVPSKQSLGMHITHRRLNLFSRGNKKASVAIADLYNDATATGTRITILLPR
jgi:ligand-binding sensor domain-containing protein